MHCLYENLDREMSVNEHERYDDEIGLRVPLRVAVLLDTEQQPAWVYVMLEKLKSLSCVAFCLVIKHQQANRNNDSQVLWKLYRNADDRLFGRVADALAMQDISSLIRDVPIREIDLSLNPHADIANYKIDVILDLSPIGAADALAGIVRYGVWRHEFGDTLVQDPSGVGRHEVFEESPLTVSRLVSHMPHGQVVCLYRSQARTVPFSPRRNRDNVYWKSAAFASRALTVLHEFQLMPKALTTSAQSKNTQPDGIQLAASLARAGAKLMGRRLQKSLFVDQWFVAFKFGEELSLPNALSGFQSIMPPKDRFWADPFPIKRDGRYFVFIEELPFATNKGYISVMEVWPDGRWSKPLKVLERDYHLSYPFLFEWQGALFMLPETGQNRTVEVYRCHRFPDDWRLESVLLENVRSADATLANVGDRWWMFVNIGEEGTELYDELHIFHAEQPFGQWKPLRGNPVKSDALSARPAGSLLHWQGALYRPAQVCAPLYGTAISLNKIERLDPEHFVEREVSRLDSAEFLGCHTYNRAEDLTVIDGFQRTPRFIV